MKIPILNGIYADEKADFRTSYPRNLIPVPKEHGINTGYLRPADGVVQFNTNPAPGIDRGGFVWNGSCYRVMGPKLVRVESNGAITTLGDVGGTEQVAMDISFDVLAIASNHNLYFWDGVSLTQNTDPDLGIVLNCIWIDGYFMTTDGVHVVVTELNDRYSVNPLKYGSAESDPDPILGILNLKDEAYVLGRYTIEVLDNIGGDFFPFQRIKGARIDRGVIGVHTAAIFMEAIAFLGGGRDEPPAVWLGINSSTVKLSTREIDQVLQNYTEAQLALATVETRVDKGHMLLLVHLPDQTLVYDGAASQVMKEAVWFTLTSSVVDLGQYRAKNLVWCYEKWLAGDPTSANVGYYTSAVSSHYAQSIGWDFGTTVLYNEGRGCIIHELELVCLPGRVALGANPIVYTSYSTDGETWSQEKACAAGKKGDRTKRIHWLGQGMFHNWRIQRFRGASDCFASFSRLEARVEPLNF